MTLPAKVTNIGSAVAVELLRQLLELDIISQHHVAQTGLQQLHSSWLWKFMK